MLRHDTTSKGVLKETQTQDADGLVCIWKDGRPQTGPQRGASQGLYLALREKKEWPMEDGEHCGRLVSPVNGAGDGKELSDLLGKLSHGRAEKTGLQEYKCCAGLWYPLSRTV